MRKLFHMRGLLRLAFALALLNSVSFANWVEIGDAGDLPGTAQVITGGGTLNNISGTITAGDLADMFLINITNPDTFSAYASGIFDSKLFLFDTAGYGVMSNDDGGALYDAYLPAGNPNGPTTAGLYYLAVSEYNFDPVSATGLIFPDYPFRDVHGPTGPGGSNPIIGWTSYANGTESYSIALTGASPVSTIPAPGALLLGSFGLGIVNWMRRRKTF